ncbi:MAG: hypothetical protein GC160_11435 [Acidobacteria bacterium]|nr:hypothetical protein [Acidobacteriota bacterium]
MSVDQQELLAVHRVIRDELQPHFAELAKLQSTPELEASPAYQAIADKARYVLDTPESGDFTESAAPAKDFYRVVGWNLERGIQYEGQLEQFRTHPYLSTADVLLLTETDVGMARSGNRNIARELARELRMHYVFTPCYLNLAKGSGVEYDMAGENELGLHGNAILSRYPLSGMRPIALENGKDKMKGREKRLGRQTAAVATVELPQGPVPFVSVHLDANSSQPHRARQMRDVLGGLPPAGPAVIGGDWNTTTFNSSSATHAILGFWVRVFMGPDNVIRNHFLHPGTKFERELFERLRAAGFDCDRCNAPGERTTSYDVSDAKTHKNLREWVPNWCFDFIRWALRNHDGQCPLKIDWFAVRELETRDPVVLHEFREGRYPPLSDHDAIGVDLRLGR